MRGSTHRSLAVVGLSIAVILAAIQNVPAHAQQASASQSILQNIVQLLSRKKSAPVMVKTSSFSSRRSSVSQPKHAAAPVPSSERAAAVERRKNNANAPEEPLPLWNRFLRLWSAQPATPPPLDRTRPVPTGRVHEFIPDPGPMWPTGTYEPGIDETSSSVGDDENRNGNASTRSSHSGGQTSSGASSDSSVQTSVSMSGRSSSEESQTNSLCIDDCVLRPDAGNTQERACIRNGDIPKKQYPVIYKSIPEERRRQLENDFRENHPDLGAVHFDAYGYISSLMITNPGIVDGGLPAIEQIIRDNAEGFGIDNPDVFSIDRCFVEQAQPTTQSDARSIVTYQVFTPDGHRRHTPPLTITKIDGPPPYFVISGHLWPGASLPNDPAIRRREMLDRLVGTRVVYGDMDHVITDKEVIVTPSSGGKGGEEGTVGNWMFTRSLGQDQFLCALNQLEVRYWWNGKITTETNDDVGPLTIYLNTDAMTGDDVNPMTVLVDGNKQLRCERTCDDAARGETCVIDCETPICGDGTLDYGWEVCDDGNTDDGDACPRDCHAPVTCGNDWCDRDLGETPQNCPSDCRDLVCGCEVMPKVDTNGYPKTYDALPPDEVAQRKAEFLSWHEDANVTFDAWGFISNLNIPNDFDDSARPYFTQNDVNFLLGFLSDNADAFGIDDPQSTQWTLTNPTTGGVITDLTTIDQHPYHSLMTALQNGVAALQPIQIHKWMPMQHDTGPQYVIQNHFWPGAFIPSHWTMKQCDLMKTVVGKVVHVTGRLRRVNENRQPLGGSCVQRDDEDMTPYWPTGEDPCADVDMDYEIRAEDVLSTSPTASFWTNPDSQQREIRYLFQPQVRLRLDRALEEIRITPVIDAITGDELKPIPREVRVPEDLLPPVIKSRSSSPSVSSMQPEIAPSPEDQTDEHAESSDEWSL